MKYKRGTSGNPAGKKPGSGHRQKLFKALVSPRKEELMNTAINMALAGNEAMLRLFLERLLPAKPVDEPIKVELDQNTNQTQALVSMGNNIMLSLSKGDLTPNEALSFLQVIASHRENIVMHDLWKQFQEFKDSTSKQPVNQSIEEDEYEK